MTKDELLKIFDLATMQHTDYGYETLRSKVQEIAREALAQTQEPVATDWERIARVQNAKLMAMCDEAGGFEKLCEVMDKYEKTTPPQRTWVGLTDEDICMFSMWLDDKSDVTVFTAIEQALKEKNT